MYAFVGIETISKEGLQKMKKSINIQIGVGNYKKIIDKFHKYRIGVLGAFIIGNDFEKKDYYKDLSNFIIKSGIDVVQVSILTPIPGSNLFNRLNEEGRLKFTDFPEDWAKYRFSHVLHKLRGTDDGDIYWGNNFIKSKIYSPYTFCYRMMNSFISLKNFASFYSVYRMNKSYKRSWQNSHYYQPMR